MRKYRGEKVGDKVELVKEKVVISGNIVEVYKYEHGYLKGYKLNGAERENKGRKRGYKSDNYEEHRKQALQRAKRDLRRIINSNVGAYGEQFTAKFLTLTFRDNIQDLKAANKEFMLFIKRLNYQLFNTKKANVKYSAVVEFQERGAIHYHVVIYNIPYVKYDKFVEWWGHGDITINKIDDVDNVGAYVTKYMSKDNADERLHGEKCYFNSRGLFKPIEETNKKKVEALTDALPVEKIKFSSCFENEHLGKINYKQYNLNTYKNK